MVSMAGMDAVDQASRKEPKPQGWVACFLTVYGPKVVGTEHFAFCYHLPPTPASPLYLPSPRSSLKIHSVASMK